MTTEGVRGRWGEVSLGGFRFVFPGAVFVLDLYQRWGTLPGEGTVLGVIYAAAGPVTLCPGLGVAVVAVMSEAVQTV